MIKITYGRGFQLTFANGLTISVQIGKYNYCRKYPDDDGQPDEAYAIAGHLCLKSENAEIAIWGDREDKWLTRKFIKAAEDDVHGFVPCDDLPAIISKVAKWKPRKAKNV